MVNEIQFDQAVCTYRVTQFMLGKEWQLVAPHILAAAIYVELRERGLEGAAAVQVISPQLLGRYAAIVYERCCDPAHEQNGRAWHELRDWLHKQVRNLAVHVNDREDVVQEAILQLQNVLENQGVEKPRALWMYASQTLRRKAIDMHRIDMAITRGGETITITFDELKPQDSDSVVPVGEQVSLTKTVDRSIENSVSNREAQANLKIFFRRHLRSEQQQLVAELSFLGGLSPKQIADLWGKKPHQIRMVKARVIQKLRALPPEERERLLRILDAADEEEPDDS